MRPPAFVLAAALLGCLALPAPSAGADDAPAAAPTNTAPAISARASAAPAKTARATIGTVTKTHGVELPDGQMGIGLNVPVDAAGLKGTTLAASIFFQDAEGKPIRSNDRGYAAPDGQLRVVSRDAIVASDPEALAFAFQVPYGAFPRRPGNGYAVMGQVRVFERTKTGRVLLATSIVQFWVGA